ncbi:MAG: type II toxin-antitoxin system RelE/ParE family toxin [Magnetococcales bacterium]|nr:type II toxin-antitoxin system RelE/ParE family toxin [Magnetococcales bacterium]
MTYQVTIQRKAKRKLQSLSVPDRYRITERILDLGRNPDDPTLDVKPLVGSSLWRLRVGDWRVILRSHGTLAHHPD